ncbi:DUF924 family protein [Haliangium sp.]|uniref:DUF924 family protein n=1 Tax=Haliangium sp. TaxID=2663208 RepID=UPI003D132F91
MQPDHRRVLEFWFDDRARARWFAADADFDDEVRNSFGDTLEQALSGACDAWLEHPDGCLALVITLDQVPRNVHRDSPRAYAYDDRARAVAERAIAAGMDRQVAWDRRVFFYLPLQHAEALEAQRRSLELTRAWAGESDDDSRPWAREHLAWAEHHHDVIARFGRFPHRNAILGRASSAPEQAFLAQPATSPGTDTDVATPAGSADPTLRRYVQANHSLWDGRAKPHFGSEFYGMEGFRRGASSLTHIEEEALGEVAGKSMLHLQCHFGQDSLSWARKGAVVTGVDFSEQAITIARSLSDELEIPARFLCSDVYALPDVLDDRFDIVFTSYGVIKWLPDIAAWARVVSRFLAPGGTFFMVEFHPFLYVFDYERAERITYPYFPSSTPIAYDEVGSYAEPGLDTVHRAYAWPHTLGDIVTSLVTAGLRLESLVEYPYSAIDCFPFVTPDAPGRYVHATHPGKVPMTYSIRAGKPSHRWRARSRS